MTVTQQLITIFTCTAATMLTRFLPFLVFSSRKPVPKIVTYLGKALPGAVFAMLVVYCLKSVGLTDYSMLGNPDLIFRGFGIPELISILVVVGLHLWKKQTLLSIAAGTVVYMLLVNFVFVA